MMSKKAKRIADPAKQARLEIEAALNAKNFFNQKDDANLLKTLYFALRLKRPLRKVLENLGFDCDKLELGLEAWIASQDPEVQRLLKIARKQSREGKMHDLHDVLKELGMKK